MLANKVWYFTRELSRVVDGAWWHLVGTKNAMGEGNAVIVFSERWSLMDDTRSAVVRNIGIVENAEGFILVLQP